MRSVGSPQKRCFCGEGVGWMFCGAGLRTTSPAAYQGQLSVCSLQIYSALHLHLVSLTHRIGVIVSSGPPMTTAASDESALPTLSTSLAILSSDAPPSATNIMETCVKKELWAKDQSTLHSYLYIDINDTWWLGARSAKRCTDRCTYPEEGAMAARLPSRRNCTRMAFSPRADAS